MGGKSCGCGKYLFLFRMAVQGRAEKENDGLGFVHYMEYSKTFDKMDEMLGCLCLEMKH